MAQYIKATAINGWERIEGEKTICKGYKITCRSLRFVGALSFSANDPKFLIPKGWKKRSVRKHLLLCLALVDFNGKIKQRHSFSTKKLSLMFMTLSKKKEECWKNISRKIFLPFLPSLARKAHYNEKIRMRTGGLGVEDRYVFLVKSRENCLLRNWIVICALSSKQQKPGNDFYEAKWITNKTTKES